MLYPPSDPETTGEDILIDPDDETVARVSLRLPASVKTKVDEKADSDGISTNAWLLRAVMVALRRPAASPPPPRAPGAAPTEKRPVRAVRGLRSERALQRGRHVRGGRGRQLGRGTRRPIPPDGAPSRAGSDDRLDATGVTRAIVIENLGRGSININPVRGRTDLVEGTVTAGTRSCCSRRATPARGGHPADLVPRGVSRPRPRTSGSECPRARGGLTARTGSADAVTATVPLGRCRLTTRG